MSGVSLTGAQAGIWLAQQLASGDPVYNIAWYLDVRGEVDLGRLGSAVRQAVAEAECVHVRFTDIEGTPHQVSSPAGPEPQWLDFRAEPDPEAAATAWMRAERRTPADLAQGPLFTHALLRLADDRVWWYQRYHHLIMDAYGCLLVTQRAGDLYAGVDGLRFGPLTDLLDSDTAYRASEQYTVDRELDEVGVHDDFFELGGHSMASMRLLGRIRSAFGVDLTITDVFDAPTVAGLAAKLGEGAALPARRPALEPGPRPERLPLAPVQRWQWNLHRQRPGFDHALALRSPGFDAGALAAALRDVAKRHEPLRTRFAGERQELTEPPELVVESGVSGVSGVDTEARLGELAAATPDLTWEPPVRATLLRSESGDALLLGMHHLAVDEWSVVPLLKDLSAAYSARLAGSAPDWEPLPVSYADYTRWSEGLPGRDEQLAYWRERLRDVPRLSLPGERERSGGGAGVVPFVLDADLHAAIDRLARQHGASLFMVLQAALATVLSANGAGTDLPIGAVVAGRTEESVGDLVGCFLNVVVLRTDVSGAPSVGELLARVRATNLEALEHQDVPFADVAEAVGWRPRVLMVQHEQARLAELEGGHGALTAVPTPVTKADLTLSCYEPRGDGEVYCYLSYAENVLDHATVERLAGELRTVVEELIRRQP